MTKFKLLNDYIDKDKYKKGFVKLFERQTCLSIISKKSTFKLDEEEKINTYMNALIPTQFKEEFCELELDNPSIPDTPKNVEFYRADVNVNSNGIKIVKSKLDESPIYCKIDGEYQEVNSIIREEWNCDIEPIKISPTEYSVLVVGHESAADSPFASDPLFLKVNLDYKKATYEWESYLVLAYQNYLSGDEKLARLLSFIAFEALIRFCRLYLTGIFESISIKKDTLANLIELGDIFQSLSNEHMRLKDKLKQLMDIFISLMKEKPIANESDILKVFKQLEKGRNSIAHGSNEESGNDQKAFLNTLRTMNNFISLIQSEI